MLDPTEKSFEGVCGFDGGESDRGDKETGVVVDEVEDLDPGTVGQVPVGRVRLPTLVGQAGLEADEGGARPLVRLWDDQAPTTEDSPDGGARGEALGQSCGKVVGDGLRSGVMTGGQQLLALLDDGGDDLLAGGSRR